MSTPVIPENLVSTSVAARKATVSGRTIRNWIREGKLKSFTVGGTVLRVDMDEVEALIQPGSHTEGTDNHG